MRLLLIVALLLMLVAPQAQAANGADVLVTIQTTGPPLIDGPPDWVIFESSEHGERYTFHIDIPVDFAVVDVRIPAGLFDVDRDRQIKPWLDVADDHYPLFESYPEDDMWNADGPAQLFRYVADGQDTILRLGLAGPVQGSLVIQRDVTPPAYEVGPIEELTHKSFRQETTTDELAIADLQVRKMDGGEWVRNPTPQYAWLQKFPIQGLDPATTHEHRIRFTDWSGNVNETSITTFTTLQRPAAVDAAIQVVSPAPNSTHVDPLTAIVATIDTAEPEGIAQVRFFLDLEEHRTGWTYDDGTLRFEPESPLSDGTHKAAVEVHDVHGNMHHKTWTFSVGEPQEEAAPAPAALALLVLAALVGLGRSRHL